MIIVQRYGRSVDSLVLSTSNPCAPRERLVVLSQASALTRLRMPHIAMDVGTVGMIPVIMDGRPSIERSLLDSFTVDIDVRSAHLHVVDGESADARWTCSNNDGRTRIRVKGRWQGNDTLVMIPAQALMSTAASTPLTFSRMPGFVWTGQACDLQYEDGSVIFGEVCGGRQLRSVSWSAPSSYRIAPNPTDGALTITPLSTQASSYHVALFNECGTLIGTYAGKGAQDIDLQDLSAGRYAVRINDLYGTHTHFIIKY